MRFKVSYTSLLAGWSSQKNADDWLVLETYFSATRLRCDGNLGDDLITNLLQVTEF